MFIHSYVYVFINLVQLAGIVHPAVPECQLQQNGSSYFYNGSIIYVCTLHCNML